MPRVVILVYQEETFLINKNDDSHNEAQVLPFPCRIVLGKGKQGMKKIIKVKKVSQSQLEALLNLGYIVVIV
jgi:hypothetical protein